MSLEPYKEKRFFGMTKDPLHVGTGGYRLGRVDNTIVRDKFTNIPIIPGSTLEGVTRTYAAYKMIEHKGNKKYLNCASKDQGENSDRQQCGNCEICITFGFSKKNESLHGMAQFSDAKILFFPVHTFRGPVWITTANILKDVGINDVSEPTKNKIKTSVVNKNEKLNLGWLYLENEDDFSLNELNEIPDEIKNKVVLVRDKLFSQIVNSNLEVRTSVSIDPQTGAAEEGALFTYEAIPRSTVLYWDVTYNNPELFPSLKEKNKKGTLKNGSLVFGSGSSEVKPVEEGMKLYEFLGVGGMGTRGFGRIKVLNSGGE